MTKFKMLRRYFSTNILYVFVLLSSICVACDKDYTKAPDPQVVTDITTKITTEKNDLKVSVGAKLSDAPNYDYSDRSVIVKYRLSDDDDDWTQEQALIKENTQLALQAECSLKNLVPETEYTIQVVCVIRTVEFPDEPMKAATLVRYYSMFDIYPHSGEPEGVVWSVSEGGVHGSIVSWDEAYTSWSSESVVTGAKDASGYKNTAVIKTLDPTLAKYPAFKWCADKGEGWYLPSFYEVFCDMGAVSMNAALDRIPGGVRLIDGNDIYWTSTELNKLYTWSNGWGNGTYVTPAKSFSRRVRACKDF